MKKLWYKLIVVFYMFECFGNIYFIPIKNWLRELFFENIVLSWEHHWISSLNLPCFCLKVVEKE